LLLGGSGDVSLVRFGSEMGRTGREKAISSRSKAFSLAMMMFMRMITHCDSEDDDDDDDDDTDNDDVDALLMTRHGRSVIMHQLPRCE